MDEICNQSDDDCDGRTDEGVGMRVGAAVLAGESVMGRIMIAMASSTRV